MIDLPKDENMHLDRPAFLRGDSVAAHSITIFPWEETGLGAPSQWASLLKQQLVNIFSETGPVFLYWMETSTLFLNDGFLNSPLSIDSTVYDGELKDLFGEGWSRCVAAFEKAKQGKASIVSHYEVIPHKQRRYKKKYIFSIAFNPIRDEEGRLRAVIARWTDCTAVQQELKSLRTYRSNSTLMIQQAPVGICIATGTPLKVIEINDVFLEITGKERQAFMTQAYWDVNYEIREVYEPISYRVMQTGESYKAKEHKVTLVRRGVPEIVYVDFVYEPLKDSEGNVVGLMVVAIEVTEKSKSRDDLQEANGELAAINEKLLTTNEDLEQTYSRLERSLVDLQISEQRIKGIIDTAPFPIGLYMGREMKIVEANQSIRDTWGKGDDVIGKSYYEVNPEVKEQGVFALLDEVYSTGIPFHTRNKHTLLNIYGELKEFYFNYSLTPLKDKDGQVCGVLNTAADVTDLNLAKQKVERSENNFRSLIHQAPFAMCLLIGDDFKIELANEAMIEIWGKPSAEVLNKPLFEALPDAREQGLEKEMSEVYTYGVKYSATEEPVRLIRFGKPDTVYQNYVYQPYLNAEGKILGILLISVNVTEQVKSRMELERAYEQLRLSKEAGQVGTFDMDMLTGKLEWDRRCRELFGASADQVITFEQDFRYGVHLDDRERVMQAIEDAKNKKVSNGDYDVEYRTVSGKTSDVRWVRAKGKIYFDEDERPLRFAGSVLETTDQKQKELWMLENMEKIGLLSALVDTSEDVIISQNMNGIITSWNGAAERMFGYNRDEVFGRHISLIHPEDRKDEAEGLARKVRAGEQVHQYESIRLDRYGRQKHLSLTLSPILDAFGEIIGVSKIARDISAQKDAQAAAERYTHRLEVLNKMIQTVSTDLDMNRILQRVTEDTAKFIDAGFGAFFYRSEKYEECTYELHTVAGMHDATTSTIDTAIITDVFYNTFKFVQTVRLADIRKDGQYDRNKALLGSSTEDMNLASFMAVPVLSRSGELIGGLVFGHRLPDQFTKDHESLVESITAQASIGLDNAKLYEKVKDLNDKKDEFIGLASHELKTPLTSISGYIQILERRLTSPQEQLFLNRAGKQIKKLTMLVNDLLDVSKIEAGKLKFTLEQFDLVKSIQESIDLLAQGHGKYVINFETNVDDCLILADSQRIEQVLLNLLNNAIKYSPGKDKIFVSLFRGEGDVKVSIQDFGIGIPADQIKKVFSRFYRVDDNVPNISGLGLGLFLSHEIITRHQGEIWVDSVFGIGSTFWIRLPI